MDKIYQQAKDKNVANVLVYIGPVVSGTEHDYYACKDREKTVKMTADELLDAFLKGAMFILIGDGPDKYATPTYCIAPSSEGTAYTTVGVNDIPGAGTNTSLVSSEYPTT